MLAVLSMLSVMAVVLVIVPVVARAFTPPVGFLSARRALAACVAHVLIT
jgi:hypothetical protein